MLEKPYLAELFRQLLPSGPAWEGYDDVADAMAEFLQIAPTAMDAVRRDTDPRTTLYGIDDFETMYGLPDSCMLPGADLQTRRMMLIAKMRRRGRLTKQFYIDLAALLGFTIDIEEDPLYHWIVWVFNGQAPIPAQCGPATCGQPLQTVQHSGVLECMFNKLKPAHTTVAFDYRDS